MAPAREAWARAFAAQSRSDWEVYELLVQRQALPACHALHYLQMATEKIAKAYRCRDTGSKLSEVLHGHGGFVRFINGLLNSRCVRKEYEGHDAQLLEIAKTSACLAREIEKLAPAVDRTHAPENAEYPWAQGDVAVAPCTYDYPSLSLLTTPRGRTFLTFVARAIREFDQIRL